MTKFFSKGKGKNRKSIPLTARTKRAKRTVSTRLNTPDKCPICGVFMSPTKPGWHGTTGSDLSGSGVEYYCKKGERDGTH